MGTRWINLLIAVGAVVLWVLADGSGMESMVGIVLAVIGLVFLVRSFLLRGGASPSAWGGRTPLGTFLTGLGLLVFGLEGYLEAMRAELWLAFIIAGTVALLLGVWIESRSASAPEPAPM